MTLHQATQMMYDALRREDLDALGLALKARGAALQAGDSPALQDFHAGEFALAALAAMKRRWAAESARLDQVRASLAAALPTRKTVRFNYLG
ncbi:MAG TPA: hypothetical protein VKV74_00020 [Bryobacteraceae bacterium]|nr:hypothetical protein [Bryobacteraceae bacterium]